MTLSQRLLMSLILLLPGSLLAEDEWDLRQDNDVTQIYTRQVPGAQLKAFRAVTQFKVPMKTVVAAITDVEAAKHWFHMCKTMEMISEPDSNGDYISYMITDAPWSIKDRDVYIQNVVHQDKETKAVTITVNDMQNFSEEKDGMVRIPEMFARWKITPLDESSTQVELIGHGEPGGMIPTWVANLVATDMPKNSFKNLRDVVQQEKYQLSNLKSNSRLSKLGIEFPHANVSVGQL